MFIFSCLLHWLEAPTQCWIEVTRVDILVLYLILRESKALSFIFKHDVSCRFYIVAFHQIKEVLFLVCWELYYVYWILSNAFFRSIEMIMWLYPLFQESATFFRKDHIVNIFGFVSYMISVVINQLCSCRMKVILDNIWMNGCNCIPINLYLQKQKTYQIWSVGHSLLTPALFY